MVRRLHNRFTAWACATEQYAGSRFLAVVECCGSTRVAVAALDHAQSMCRSVGVEWRGVVWYNAQLFERCQQHFMLLCWHYHIVVLQLK